MAAEVSGGGNIEPPSWLKSMPVAPEYHPTLAEFQDPIGYIFKIEKEAGKYGICKIVPPVAAASKKTVVANMNKSLLLRSGDEAPTFSTRQQQIGFCPRKHHPVRKPVWQSGERYTLDEFEAKAKSFERSYLKKYVKKGLSPLEIEALYWNASVDKPFTVEYANDMPGSAFVAVKSGKRKRRKNQGAVTVGETKWNMRRVARENLSLLRFMKEEIPGVTSPMVYVAMMFSWFAWHVEDHDLHSLNYLHMGAGKTWYGVPQEAAVAFEEVVREHGYGGEINPLVTFAKLGEKTTVMSPEVLLGAGVPCCRLVQNAGEFVVTFPRAYHSGFSHGFNCGEASNIATPDWLRFARDAAIRRAAINCAPMVSHFQLLYDLALSLCLRKPKSIVMEPRSSRLKDKKRSKGEMLIKEQFLQEMMQNNDMLNMLGKGSPIVLLPNNSLSHSVCSRMPVGFKSTTKSRLFPSLCSPDLELKTSFHSAHEEIMLDRKHELAQKHDANESMVSYLYSSQELFSLAPCAEQMDLETKKTSQSEQGLFSCVTCGVLCFACVAIVRPSEAAAHYLMSAECSMLQYSGASDNENDSNADLCSASMLGKTQDGHCKLSSSADQIQPPLNQPSSLGLLALAYGETSDVEEETDIPVNRISKSVSLENRNAHGDTDLKITCGNEASLQMMPDPHEQIFHNDGDPGSFDHSDELPTESCTTIEPNSLTDSIRSEMRSQHDASDSLACRPEAMHSTGLTPLLDSTMPSSDEESSRLHIFCLQHAIQVKAQLSRVGGAHLVLVCHPGYPKLESQAKRVAEELESNHLWSEILFRIATEEDEETIRLALESENVIHGNGDWAVKMGINLFYSANLSRSPLYCKQMHYNSVIYSAFGRSSPTYGLTTDYSEPEGRSSSRQKKIVVAGKWCGKVWMSSRAHGLLINKESWEEDEETLIGARIKPGFEHVRLSEGGQSSGLASSVCRSDRKRKICGKNCVQVKEEEDSESRSSAESSEEVLVSKLRKQVKSIQVKKVSPEVENSNDSSEEYPLSNTWKQIKGEVEAKRMRKETTPGPLRRKKRNEDEQEGGPSTRLRKRMTKPCKDSPRSSAKAKPAPKKQQKDATTKKTPLPKVPVLPNKATAKIGDEEAEFVCNVEGCAMGFATKHELALHKRNVCPVKGCGKKFFSHKYLVQHRRVHVDDRPLKCSWKGCKMTFKWAWARTEHLRVHTGARPYVCTEPGCGKTFRFVSDFSRHRRKTGHSPKKAKG